MKRFALLFAVLLSLCYSKQGLAQNGSPRMRLPSATGTLASEFGAVVDDGVDDSDALNAAIVYAYNNNRGPVQLSGGRYNVSKTIVLYANTGLIGVGDETELFLAAGSDATLTSITTDLNVPSAFYPIITPLTTGGPHAGIVVTDLSINGNGANQDDGSSYTNITTFNSTGMIIDRIRSVDCAQSITGANRSFCLFVYGKQGTAVTLTTAATWTDATNTVTETGKFATASVGDRIRFTAGTGVNTGQDYFIVTVTSDDAVVVHADINAAGGDVAAGTITGTMFRDSVATPGVCSYAKITNSYFDNAMYDCVTVRGIATRYTTIDSCTILRGKQTSLQIYDRAPDTTISNCKIDNTGTADSNTGAGIILHAARRPHIDDCTVLTDNQSNAISVFGDNAAGFSEPIPPNYAEDVSINGGVFKYIGNDASAVGFSSTPEYMRRVRFADALIEALAGEDQSNGAAVSIGDEAVGGLSFVNCRLRSNSNTPTFTMTFSSGNPSKNIAFVGGTIENFGVSTSFDVFRAVTITGDNGATPDQQAISFTGTRFLWADPGSTGVRLINGAGAALSGCVFIPTGSTAHTAAMLEIDNFDDAVATGCLFQGHVTNAAPVITLTNDPRSVTVTSNIIQTGIDNTTAPVYGIGCSTGATYITIADNDFRTCSTSAFFTTFGPSTGSIVRHNKATTGKTENNGTATMTDTAETITHGLTAWRTLRASDIVIQFAELASDAPGDVYITNIGATTFDINLRTDPGVSDLDLTWTAKINEY